MRTRVLDTWRRLAGLEPPSVLTNTLTAALQLRARLDDHHPWALHPARTLLILMDDCAEADPAVLAGAAGVDSMAPEWHAAPPVLAALGEAGTALPRLSPHAVVLPESVPVPAGEGELLLEALLAAPRRIRLVACAERLDHARHLHMIEYPAAAAFREGIAAIYQPVAARTDALLERRFARWLRAGERRRRASG